MSMFASSTGLVGSNGPTHPEYDAYAVTPSDTVDLPGGSGNNRGCRAIQVMGAGNVSVNLTGGGTAVLTGLSALQRVVLSASRVLATGTTATGITALY